MSIIDIPRQELVTELFDQRPDVQPHIDIIATAGPRTDNKIVAASFLRYVDIVRFNLGQNTDDEASQRLTTMMEVAADIGRLDSLRWLVDVAGVKLRTGRIKETVIVEDGKPYRFQFEDYIDPESSGIIPIQHDVSDSVSDGHRMSMFDGKLPFKITGVDERRVVHAVAKGNGILHEGTKQGMNFPDSSFESGYVEADRQRLPFVAAHPAINYLLASYVQGPNDMHRMAADATALDIPALRGAKVEDKTGMRNVAGIIEVSDLTIVAQGDMGPEIGREHILEAMLRIAFEANSRDKEWAVATGMMESVANGNPASPADLGYSGLAAMLGGKVWVSAETAMNPDNIEVVQTLRRQVDLYAGRVGMLLLASPRRTVEQVLQASNGNH
jgi:pyruvate kinase